MNVVRTYVNKKPFLSSLTPQPPNNWASNEDDDSEILEAKDKDKRKKDKFNRKRNRFGGGGNRRESTHSGRPRHVNLTERKLF